jgi:hypothetical protein
VPSCGGETTWRAAMSMGATTANQAARRQTFGGGRVEPLRGIGTALLCDALVMMRG